MDSSCFTADAADLSRHAVPEDLLCCSSRGGIWMAEALAMTLMNAIECNPYTLDYAISSS